MKPMMNDDGLLECPFCGDTHAYMDNDGSGSFYVACSQCGCSTDQWLTQGKSVKSWNTRNGHLYTANDYKQDAMERANGL